ncbi:MAG: metallophosphoesterase, partial [Planctomycetota bacterium]|nr:metallophosphoesterase [Planctomycetota bacterium]
FPSPAQLPTEYRVLEDSADFPKPFLIVGDTQRSSLYEQWIMRREENVDVSIRLLKEAGKEDAGFLVLVGDMVFDASSKHQWADFDRLLDPIHESGKALLPVVGNHEYWGVDSWCKDSLHQRFPLLKEKTWYRRNHGPVALLILNSNFKELTPSEKAEQKDWFDSELEKIDADQAMRGFLVFTHHPPYSNSWVVSGDNVVHESFAKPFRKSKKGLAFVSGHAHGYEHLKKRSKHFLVSAGGGGARFGRRPKDNRDHTDLFQGPDLRPFHYIKVSLRSTGLRFEVKGFVKRDSALSEIESFLISFPL